MNTEYDAVIVGGGPIGCRVAGGLALAGYQVKVLEKKPSLELPICCTSLVSEECFRKFDLDLKLVIKSFHSAVLFSPSSIDIHLSRDHVQAHLLNRPELDKYLLQKAVQSGCSLSMNTLVTGISPKENCVEIEIERNNVRQVIRARVAVISAGFGLPFTRGTGVKRHRDSAIGVQAMVKAELTEIEIYLNKKYAPGFFAWLVPISGFEAFAGLIARRNAKKQFGVFVEQLLKDGKIKECSKPVLRGITMNSTNKTYGTRFLLVGDCAGQVKPLTGGGIYYGLLSADIAVEVLKDAFRINDLSDKFLSLYERKWRILLDKEIKPAKYFRKIFSLFNNGQIDFAIDFIKRHNIDERL